MMKPVGNFMVVLLKMETFMQTFEHFIKQVCIPVGCVPPACCPYLPACTVSGCEQTSENITLPQLHCSVKHCFDLPHSVDKLYEVQNYTTI